MTEHQRFARTYPAPPAKPRAVRREKRRAGKAHRRAGKRQLRRAE